MACIVKYPDQIPRYNRLEYFGENMYYYKPADCIQTHGAIRI